MGWKETLLVAVAGLFIYDLLKILIRRCLRYFGRLPLNAPLFVMEGKPSRFSEDWDRLWGNWVKRLEQRRKNVER